MQCAVSVVSWGFAFVVGAASRRPATRWVWRMSRRLTRGNCDDCCHRGGRIDRDHIGRRWCSRVSVRRSEGTAVQSWAGLPDAASALFVSQLASASQQYMKCDAGSRGLPLAEWLEPPLIIARYWGFVHFWLLPTWHSHRWRRAPLFMLPSTTSKQRPELTLRYWLWSVRIHC